MKLTSALLSALMALALPGLAQADDPDAYDPILDGEGDGLGAQPSQRVERASLFPGGFIFGAGASVYAGRVKSFLTSESSRLDSGARPGFSVTLAGRTSGPIEIGADFMLGLGRTWNDELDRQEPAFDLLFEPRVTWHFIEEPGFGLYGGAGAQGILFDMESAGINQGGIGPTAVVGIIPARDRHSHLFIEGGATAFYDFLAYRFENPDARTLAQDPTAEPKQVDGAWYPIFRFTVGYRMTNF